MLLRQTLGTLAGAEAVVLGRSNIVGKPMAALLLAENCTVTLAHSSSRDLAAIARRADILVAAGNVDTNVTLSGTVTFSVGAAQPLRATAAGYYLRCVGFDHGRHGRRRCRFRPRCGIGRRRWRGRHKWRHGRQWQLGRRRWRWRRWRWRVRKRLDRSSRCDRNGRCRRAR